MSKLIALIKLILRIRWKIAQENSVFHHDFIETDFCGNPF